MINKNVSSFLPDFSVQRFCSYVYQVDFFDVQKCLLWAKLNNILALTLIILGNKIVTRTESGTYLNEDFVSYL